MDWKNKTLLVTGPGGFIGSHLVESLLANGANVRAISKFNSQGDPGLLKQLPGELTGRLKMISGDLRDIHDMHVIYEAARECDLVYHLGALIQPPSSGKYLDEGPVSSYIQIMGSLNVLLACREMGVGRLVHVSVKEVSHVHNYAPQDDEIALSGECPSRAIHYEADNLVESFCREYDLPVVTVCPYNTFWPWQSVKAVIPSFILQALSTGIIQVDDLDECRDFTYIMDTVEGFLLAGSVDAAVGGVYNLGTGQQDRLGEIALRIAQKIGHKVEIMIKPKKAPSEKAEPLHLVSDNSLACNTLGWEPQVSLDDGLDKTIAWMRSHLDV